jgi:hypothetical protein
VLYRAADRARALRIEAKLDAIAERIETLMALSAPVLALLKQIDDATNAIATRLSSLANAHADDPDLVAALTKEVATLQGLGANPAQPVPGVAAPPGLATF